MSDFLALPILEAEHQEPKAQKRRKSTTKTKMKIDRLKLRDLFSYHPPVDEDRKKAHEVVNTASEDFAIALSEVIDDPAELTTLLRKIQEVRMLANQAIAFKSVGIGYRGIYKDTES